MGGLRRIVKSATYAELTSSSTHVSRTRPFREEARRILIVCYFQPPEPCLSALMNMPPLTEEDVANSSASRIPEAELRGREARFRLKSCPCTITLVR